MSTPGFLQHEHHAQHYDDDAGRASEAERQGVRAPRSDASSTAAPSDQGPRDSSRAEPDEEEQEEGGRNDEEHARAALLGPMRDVLGVNRALEPADVFACLFCGAFLFVDDGRDPQLLFLETALPVVQ